MPDNIAFARRRRGKNLQQMKLCQIIRQKSLTSEKIYRQASNCIFCREYAIRASPESDFTRFYIPNPSEIQEGLAGTFNCCKYITLNGLQIILGNAVLCSSGWTVTPWDPVTEGRLRSSGLKAAKRQLRESLRNFTYTASTKPGACS